MVKTRVLLFSAVATRSVLTEGIERFALTVLENELAYEFGDLV